jgi:hypothetical protein
MALLASLFATMLLTCLGMSLVLLGSTNTKLASHDLQAAGAAWAAHAAVTLATSELRARGDWSGLFTDGTSPDTCSAPGQLIDTSLTPPAPWDGSPIDLPALTQQWQQASDAAAPAGTTPPQWRLFEFGPISRVMPAEPRRHPFYVVVWTADGRGGLVLLHATALGAGSLRASVEVSLAKDAGGSVERRAIRSVP